MNLIRCLPRFRIADRSLEQLRARREWPRQRIDAYQIQRLNKLWQHAIHHVAHYRRLRDELALPHQFETLDEFRSSVPLLDKDTVRNDYLSFLSDQSRAGKWRWTSGSTGSPMRFFWAHQDHQEMLRCRYAFYADWGVDIFDRVGYVWGAAQHRWLTHWRQRVVDWSRNRVRMSGYQLEREQLDRTLEKFSQFRPVMIYGLSTAMYLLALRAEEIGVRWSELKLAVLTGEVAGQHMLNAVEGSFGAPAIAEYGATESPLIAGHAHDGTLRIREDAVLAETIPGDHDLNEIILTVLLNTSFPLIRYRIGDVTDRDIERPRQGFAYLASVRGRNSDVVVSKSGKRIHSARLDLIFESPTHGNGVRNYRVHQAADTSVLISVEPAGEAAVIDQPKLMAAFRKVLGDLPLQVQVVDELPFRYGKQRIITSELGAPYSAADRSRTSAEGSAAAGNVTRTTE